MSKCRYDLSEDCHSKRDCLICVLDKIRAEIDSHREKLKIMADDDWYAGKIRGYDCAIEIIDKYKASPTGAEGSDKE